MFIPENQIKFVFYFTTIIFFIIATPVALMRRMYGADSMKRKDWKRGHSSVFSKRGHLYSAEDLEKP